jgi:serine/threonine-protein kinase
MSKGAQPMLLFDTPILFQKTEVGRVYLGLAQDGVASVLKATAWLMAALGLLAVLAVIGLSQVFGLLLLRPIRLLRRSLNTFGEGDWDLRISQTRRDEIGEIYSAFNRMAEKVQSRLSQDEETRPQADVPVLDIPPDAVVPETTIRAEILRA